MSILTMLLDYFSECDVCGGNHLTEACPELGLASSIEDQHVSRYVIP